MRKTVADQHDADDRDQRKQAPVWPFADLGDQRSAPIAHGHKHMRAEKDNEPENFDSKSHDYQASLAGHGRDHGERALIVNDRSAAFRSA